MKDEKIVQLSRMIKTSQRIVFFTGAGASTESGIPDFRSADGIYNTNYGREVSSEEMISHDFFEAYPKDFYDFYFENLLFPNAEPNSGHYFMAELENEGKEIDIVTQNIDGLHQKAGSNSVHELHGTTLSYTCTTCGEHYDFDELQLDADGIPRCTKDQGLVRPDIVLYQESLPTKAIEDSIQAISGADMVVIAGTSLVVYPAAGFIQYYSGDKLVVINKSEVTPARAADLSFTDSIGNVVKSLKNYKE